MDAKNINSLPAVSPNDTRKMLCGDGVIPISSLKAFINSELSASLSILEAALQTLRSEFDASSESLASCLTRISAIETSISAIRQILDGVGYATLLGYVYEEDSEGNLTLLENEKGEWRTVKIGEGRYTQKFVAIEEEPEENESEES